jgi:predicted 3-demethylubiquinone-9 3-methyltransferase (glyoxalase superfamily)
MSCVSTCFWFDRSAEAAATLYTALIPNSRIVSIMRHGEGAPMPAGHAHVVDFELDGVPYRALNGGPMYKLNEAASISVSCETQAEIDKLWDALTAEGGRELACGWLVDRFGLTWQIIPSRLNEWMSDPAAAARVVAAFMPMMKLDIATLEAAARG